MPVGGHMTHGGIKAQGRLSTHEQTPVCVCWGGGVDCV